MNVSRSDRTFTLFFEVLKESRHYVGVDLIEGKSKWGNFHLILNETEQKSKCVTEGSNRSHTGVLLIDQALTEKPLQQRWKINCSKVFIHCEPPLPLPANSSGIPLRYQYVSLILTWPKYVESHKMALLTSIPSRYHCRSRRQAKK